MRNQSIPGRRNDFAGAQILLRLHGVLPGNRALDEQLYCFPPSNVQPPELFHLLLLFLVNDRVSRF